MFKAQLGHRSVADNPGGSRTRSISSSYFPALINSTQRKRQLAGLGSQASAITFRNKTGDSTSEKGVARQTYVCLCGMRPGTLWPLHHCVRMHFNNIPFHNHYFASNWAALTGKLHCSFIAEMLHSSISFVLDVSVRIEIDTNETIIDKE